MASASLRREVLQSFKDIHRARCLVFEGDVSALSFIREQINSHYRKHIAESDADKIKELIKFAYEVIHEMKTNVLQLKEVQPGKYRAQIRPDMFENQCDGNSQKKTKQE